jgi:lactoylglutathione lyase
MKDCILSGIVIELHVPDFEPAIRFYAQLGFEVVWRRDAAEGYLVMKRGPNILNFYCGTACVYEHRYFRRYPQDTPRGYGVEIVIPVEDVQTLYKDLLQRRESGRLEGRVVEELQKRPWGKFDFRMEDPFGFYVRLCEPDNWLEP